MKWVYKVVPAEPTRYDKAGWTVLCNGIPVRRSTRRDLMERYATDPAWRLRLAYGSMQAEKMVLER